MAAHVSQLQMKLPTPKSGYTLPVFACAAAIAALRQLQQTLTLEVVLVDLIEPAETVEIAIEQVALLTPNLALAITRSDPGDNLDLTRNMPIWATVGWGDAAQVEPILVQGGEGIGRRSQDGSAAIYGYADRLLQTNLQRWLPTTQKICVTLILPEGRSLAKRTSNEAFGVVEGLSLLGTSGISQPLSAPGQLEAFRLELQQKAAQFDCLVFCIGENGLDLARQLGIPADCLVKTANWLGPLLVEAGMQGLESILLFGYHGKLIKLAGGIFHTHHHVADGRIEILTTQAAKAGLPITDLQKILACDTTEAGLQYLRALGSATGKDWVREIYGAIAHTIDQRSQRYIYTHCDRAVTIGTVLFDRDRQIIAKSASGSHLLEQVLIP